MSSPSSPFRSPSPEPTSAPRISKRKADVDDDDEEVTISKRAAKRKKSKKSKPIDADEDIDGDSGLNAAIARMDGRLMADHIARQTKRFEPELSQLELEDKRVPEHAFVDTGDWTKPRNLENLPSFLEKYARGSKKSLTRSPSETNGAPHTIVVSSAGLRAADLTRTLRVFQKKPATVAKLFAKHIKLKDAITSAKSTRMSIGVGTPRRILDLIEDGALSLKHVDRILIDASQTNAKKRGILDMPETEIPLIKLLAHEELAARYSQGKDGVKLLMY